MKWNSYVIRLTGTFIGLIVGLLVWYIGGWFSRLSPLARLEGRSFREWAFPWKCVRDGRKRRCLHCAYHVHPAFRSSAVPPGCCSHGSMWWSFPVRFLNPSYPQSTAALIVGYSWVDGHLPVISNVGIGWPVAWKRWTLVMIGMSSVNVLRYSHQRETRLRCVFYCDAIPCQICS
jgi:hypothetical protein